MASIGVAIINYNRFAMLRRVVESVLATDGGVVFDLLVNDVGSTDGGRAWIAEQEALGRCKALFDPMPDDGPPVYSYAQSVNRCATHLFAMNPDAAYYFPLNNDNEVRPGWLVRCVETYATDESIGHVGPKVLYGPEFPQMAGKVQSAGAFFRHFGHEWQTRSAYCGEPGTWVAPPYAVDYCGFGMYRRDLFEKFGGLSEDFPPIYWDDPDWSLTLLTNGYRTVCDPRAVIIHDHLDTTRMYAEPERAHHFAANAGGGPNKQKFLAKWNDVLMSDGRRASILPEVVGC